MMHGLEFHDESLGGLVLRLLMERRVTSTYSLYNNHVLRVQPPMVISFDELAHGLDVIEEVVAVVEAYRDANQGIPLLPPVTTTIRVPRAAADMVALLHRRPHVLDPFAMDPESTADIDELPR
jgi:putrescine aminotransferase